MNPPWVDMLAAIVAGELSLHLPFVRLAGLVLARQRRGWTVIGDAQLDDEVKATEVLRCARQALGYALALCGAILLLALPFVIAGLAGPKSLTGHLAALTEFSTSVWLTLSSLAYIGLRLALRR